MRKLKLQIGINFDGFVAGPNGEGDWLTPDRKLIVLESRFLLNNLPQTRWSQ